MLHCGVGDSHGSFAVLLERKLLSQLKLVTIIHPTSFRLRQTFTLPTEGSEFQKGKLMTFSDSSIDFSLHVRESLMIASLKPVEISKNQE